MVDRYQDIISSYPSGRDAQASCALPCRGQPGTPWLASDGWCVGNILRLYSLRADLEVSPPSLGYTATFDTTHYRPTQSHMECAACAVFVLIYVQRNSRYILYKVCRTISYKCYSSTVAVRGKNT